MYEFHLREIQKRLREEAENSWGSDNLEAIATMRQAGLSSHSTSLTDIADAAQELDALKDIALDIRRFSHPSSRAGALLRAIWAGEQCARRLSSLVASVTREASAALGQIEEHLAQPTQSITAEPTSSHIPATIWRKVADTPELTWPRIARVGADPSEELIPAEIMKHQAVELSRLVAVLDTPSGRCELAALQARILGALRTGPIHVVPWAESEYIEPA